MKCKDCAKKVDVLESLPVRGAWVEIPLNRLHPFTGVRRSPCGERGLKFA